MGDGCGWLETTTYLKEVLLESLRVRERPVVSGGSCFGISVSAVLPLSSSGCSFRKLAFASTTILYASLICIAICLVIF